MTSRLGVRTSGSGGGQRGWGHRQSLAVEGEGGEREELGSTK